MALASEFISQMQASRKIINLIAKDVSKALDKVWHEGLRYMMKTQYQILTLTIKLLSTFLKTEDSKDKIK